MSSCPVLVISLFWLDLPAGQLFKNAFSAYLFLTTQLAQTHLLTIYWDAGC